MLLSISGTINECRLNKNKLRSFNTLRSGTPGEVHSMGHSASISQSRMKMLIERYTRKRIIRLRNLLNSCNTSLTAEVLHHIRVEIKKIKAVLRLLHFHNKKFDDRRALQAFRKIFKACGEMRDRKLHYDLAKKITGKALLPLSDNSTYQQKFISGIPKNLRDIRKAEKSMIKEARTLQFSTHRRYLKRRRKELEPILSPSFHRAALHSARKAIKEILYLSRIILGKQDINPFYDKSASLIGDWHDKIMLIEKLHASGKPHKIAVNTLQRQCNDDLKALKTLIKEFYQ